MVGAAHLRSSKLAELRAKTDRDLAAVIDNALELGLLLAYNETEVDPAGVLYRRAADIYVDTVMLIAVVKDASEQQWLERKLAQLRKDLDRSAHSRMACHYRRDLVTQKRRWRLQMLG
jgi:hypothetical protein